MQLNARRFVLGQLLAIGVALIGSSSAPAQLRPEPDAIDVAPPPLIGQLRTNPITYFRFVNRPWVARVCDVFADDMRQLAMVRLHGDAHVEQFALTDTAWGLDDFDDSAQGPALVDIVRFLGSIDLVARQRGWTAKREALFDRFLEGYRRGLAEPGYRFPQPDIVRRLRTEAPRSHAAFLAWGDSLMGPTAEVSNKAVTAAMDAISRLVQPDLPPGYLTVVRAGWLSMGVGSAMSLKILIRIQGPSTAPEDDELVEAKQVRTLGGLRCLEPPRPTQRGLRVILGEHQLGRLHHEILAAGPELVLPELVARGRQLSDWWIHSWERSYRELSVRDLRSAEDLAEIAFDAGVQLGAGCVKEAEESRAASARNRELAQLVRLEPKIRKETSRLVDQLLVGWNEFRVRRQ